MKRLIVSAAVVLGAILAIFLDSAASIDYGALYLLTAFICVADLIGIAHLIRSGGVFRYFSYLPLVAIMITLVDISLRITGHYNVFTILLSESR